jgi:hypothetical protein
VAENIQIEAGSSCAAAQAAFSALVKVIRDPRPWWQNHLAIAQRVLEKATSSTVAAALNAARTSDVPVRFAPSAALPVGDSYEAFIARTGCVPTCDNLHDLLNGLMWLSFPLTKSRMNALQAEQIALRGTVGPRGAIRDALTLFDENAALLQAPRSLVEALRARDWSKLFLSLRADWNSAQLVIFGHALLEKLMQPRKAITAHVWIIDEIDDASIAASLTHQRLSSRPFLRLPVLGVPRWWPANESTDFYEDRDVFRMR